MALGAPAAAAAGSLLLLCAPLLLAEALRDANDPARLVRGQEEWPEAVGCPLGYLPDRRPKAQSQYRPGKVICVKGNSAKCIVGDEWYMEDRRECLQCTCQEGSVADCLRSDQCPPKKTRFPSHNHYNCGRNKKKVCPDGCRFLSREVRCVNCECPP